MTSSVPPINAKQGVQRHARISLIGFAACIEGPAFVHLNSDSAAAKAVTRQDFTCGSR
jgi:hypothetical protein